MYPKPPSARQLSYLKALAERTGQTFRWPESSAAASREIRRLKNTRRARSRAGDRAARRHAGSSGIPAQQPHDV
jgi:hypothetical protein